MRTPEDRLTELEIKSSYADDLLEQLNDVVARQQLQIDALRREVLLLRTQLADQGQAGGVGSGHEPPPHY
jgi:SlyX protein